MLCSCWYSISTVNQVVVESNEKNEVWKHFRHCFIAIKATLAMQLCYLQFSHGLEYLDEPEIYCLMPRLVLELLSHWKHVQKTKMNLEADEESRTVWGRCDWMLHSHLFAQINKALDPLEVDLFTSCLIHQLLRYFSWIILNTMGGWQTSNLIPVLSEGICCFRCRIWPPSCQRFN